MQAPVRGWLLTLCLMAPASAQAPPLPRFDQYPAADVFAGKPAAPVLKTANQRSFRTRIREGAAKGVNFAGHYTIADWGCGAGCISIAVIDAKDGMVYDGPFKVLAWKASTESPLEFRKDSRLLIAHGCPEENNCASYFWEWSAPKFKLLRKGE